MDLGLALLLAGLCAGARLYGMDGENLDHDEVITYCYLNAPDLGAFMINIRASNPPISPLYFVILYYWYHLGPPTELWARMLSIVMACASTVLLYVLGRHLFGRSAGVVAAAVHALAIEFVFYGNEIRMYALEHLLVLLALYFFFRGMDAARRPGDAPLLWLAATAAANGLIVQTHLLGALLVPGQAAALYFGARRRWMAAYFLVLHAITMVPGILWVQAIFRRGMNVGLTWIQPAGLDEVAAALSGISGYLPLDALFWLPVLKFYLALASFVLVLALLCPTLRRLGDAPAAERLRALFTCAWLPALLLVLFSIYQPSLVVRYYLYFSLVWLLLIGGLVQHLPDRRLRLIAAAGIIALNAAGFATSERPLRPQWRAAVAYAMQHGSPCLDWLIYPPQEDHVLLWYSRHAGGRPVQPMKDLYPIQQHIAYAQERGLNTVLFITDWRSTGFRDLVLQQFPWVQFRTWYSRWQNLTVIIQPRQDMPDSAERPHRVTPRKFGTRPPEP
jgi:4-amino-4-deoxy-L-arabinose transferase-like glycosyltransferase